MGIFYRSWHELVFAFKKGTAAHINSFELGQHGRYRTNVWSYKGMNNFGAGRNEEIQLHPTVKPVAMIADAIKDVSRRNGIVLDLFGGSGSTLIAAHTTGRRGYLCELDPQYCDRIIRRWQAYTKDDAVLEVTGKTFEEVTAERNDRHRRTGPPRPVAASQTWNSSPEPKPAEDLSGTTEELLVCWLPSFHPAYSDPGHASGTPSPKAAECDATIAQSEEGLNSRKKRKYRQELLDELAHEQKIREIISRVLPD